MRGYSPSEQKRTAPRWLLAVALLSVAALPASARRHYRHRVVHHRGGGARRAIPLPAVSPGGPEVVRSVIVFLADGYGDSDWQSARSVSTDGFLPTDRMPWTGVVLAPSGAGDSETFIRAFSSGLSDSGGAISTLLGAAKAAGKRTALVSGEALTDPIPAGLAVTGPWDAATLPRLAAQPVDVLLTRAALTEDTNALPVPYRPLTDATAVVSAESAPLLGVVQPDALTFDSLTFRALHIVAKSRTGFAMAVTATPDTVKPAEFEAAIATALRYAKGNDQTLVLVAERPMSGPSVLFASGPGAPRLAGTLLTSDVPKIVSGLAHFPFRRDFSTLYVTRRALLNGDVFRRTATLPIP